MGSKVQLINSNCSITVIFFFTIIILLFHNCAWATGIFSRSNQQIDIPTNADSYVIAGSLTNLGSHVTLDVYNSESEVRVVIIRFDVFNLSVPINTCTLRLTTNFVLAPHIVDVYGCITTTWDENKITWGTLPSYEDQILDSQNVNSTIREFYDWDVTSWVKTHTTFGNVTFILKSDTVVEQSGQFPQVVSFISKEGGSPPLLVINEDPTPLTSSTLDENLRIPFLIILLIGTGGIFYFVIYLFLRRTPAPSDRLLLKGASKPPTSSETKKDMTFTPLAKKLFTEAADKPVPPAGTTPIDLDSEVVPTPKERRSFFCQIDGQKHPAIDLAYECEQCSRMVCGACYESSKAVGVGSCPFCQGRLIRIQ